ncbi:MAG: hypothetical protein K2K56_04230 [Lachnospiraceae bacterium]|nr:hypothetical protein [Lachnospiraceae bacterium]
MASIADKSRTKEIIDRLQVMIDNASAVPLAPGKISVYKDELQSLLTELATQIEIELKTYHEVNDRKGKIISEAKKEAEKIIYQAEHSASRMRVKKHATDVEPLNYDTLNEEERSALDNANEIYGASLIYTDEMLTEVTNLINDVYRNIRSDYEIILQVLEEKLTTINNNRAELMYGLQEMDTSDRSQQILEIGQLLSSELYMSRMKAKMDSDVYDDGSVQLSFDLQEEQEEKTRQAEEKAQRAEAALAEITAERDALAAAVQQMARDDDEVNDLGTTRILPGARSGAMGMATGAAAKAAESAVKAASAAVEAMEEAEEPMVKMSAGAGTASEEAAARIAARSAEIVERSEKAFKEETPLFVKMVDRAPAAADNEDRQPETVDNLATEDEEYEIVYVTEDELEEGEEYEIEYVDELDEDVEYEVEYVDEEDLEENAEHEEYVEEGRQPDEAVSQEPVKDSGESAADAGKAVTQKQEEKNSASNGDSQHKTTDDDKSSEEIQNAETVATAEHNLPVIPHFKKSESVASVPSEKVARMAKAITTDKKYSGLISRAVKQREKAEEEAAVAVEKSETIAASVDGTAGQKAAGNKKGKRKSVQVDEDYEIMEF